MRSWWLQSCKYLGKHDGQHEAEKGTDGRVEMERIRGRLNEIIQQQIQQRGIVTHKPSRPTRFRSGPAHA